VIKDELRDSIIDYRGTLSFLHIPVPVYAPASLQGIKPIGEWMDEYIFPIVFIKEQISGMQNITI